MNIKRKGNLLLVLILAGLSFVGCKELPNLEMIKIPGKDFKMLKTEVTQKLYESIMGENPSEINDSDTEPVENLYWDDAIIFCNKLSLKYGLKPVYSLDGTTDVKKWKSSVDNVTQDKSADGFRLPTLEEWQYAAKGGENYEYSGSNNLKEIGWYYENTGGYTHHSVGGLKPNGYGLYDMSGNVYEWVWDSSGDKYCHYLCGGCFESDEEYCKIDSYLVSSPEAPRAMDVGFRVVCLSHN